MFIWHEKKRRTNLTKHGIDFTDAETIFSGHTLTAEDDRHGYGEPRFLTLGLFARRGGIHHLRSAQWRRQNHFHTQGHPT